MNSDRCVGQPRDLVTNKRIISELCRELEVYIALDLTSKVMMAAAAIEFVCRRRMIDRSTENLNHSMNSCQIDQLFAKLDRR